MQHTLSGILVPTSSNPTFKCHPVSGWVAVIDYNSCRFTFSWMRDTVLLCPLWGHRQLWPHILHHCEEGQQPTDVAAAAAAASLSINNGQTVTVGPHRDTFPFMLVPPILPSRGWDNTCLPLPHLLFGSKTEKMDHTACFPPDSAEESSQQKVMILISYVLSLLL